MDFDRAKHLIKERISLEEIVSGYTNLVHSGSKLKGLSPFSNEKTPSFFVDPIENFYYCFSTNKGGDLFSFVQEMEGVDFKEALKILAEKAGVDLKDNGENTRNTTKLYDILERVKNIYIKDLTEKNIKYLNDRGLSEETIKKWEVGFAKDTWNNICNEKLEEIKDYELASICILKEKSTYDRFRDRIMFPFFDDNNRVIGFSGRALKNDIGAKYINSSESPIFNKSTFLFGLNFAKKEIRKNDFSIITEGQFDTILIHQAGYPVAVATSGTSVTKEHLLKLQRLSKRIIIAFDGDVAGSKATIKVINLAFSIGMDVKVVWFEDNKDPADLILEDKSKFNEKIKNSLPALEFLMKYVVKTYGEKEEQKIRGVNEIILPSILNIEDPILKDHSLNIISDFLNISKDAVKEKLEKIKPNIVPETNKLYRKKDFFDNNTFEDFNLTKKGDLEKQIKNRKKEIELILLFLQNKDIKINTEVLNKILEYEALNLDDDNSAKLEYAVNEYKDLKTEEVLDGFYKQCEIFLGDLKKERIAN